MSTAVTPPNCKRSMDDTADFLRNVRPVQGGAEPQEPPVEFTPPEGAEPQGPPTEFIFPEGAEPEGPPTEFIFPEGAEPQGGLEQQALAFLEKVDFL